VVGEEGVHRPVRDQVTTPDRRVQLGIGWVAGRAHAGEIARRQPPARTTGSARPTGSTEPRPFSSLLVLQSQFVALLLVVGASSGGLMASSPDRPGERERRIDWWAPDQAGQQPAQLSDGERDEHAQGGHHDSPPSPSATSGRRARVAARNARAAMDRVTCRYQAGYWRTW
jgi:hypothetical protein